MVTVSILGLVLAAVVLTLFSLRLSEANQYVRVPVIRRAPHRPTDVYLLRTAGLMVAVLSAVFLALTDTPTAWVVLGACATPVPALAVFAAHNRRIARGGLTVLG